MRMRTVLMAMGLVGLGVALAGCQQPLCPRGDELAKAGQAQQAVDAYLQSRSAEKDAKRRSELNDRIRALTPQIVEPVLKKWNDQPPQTLPQYNQAIADLDSVRRYDEPNSPWGLAKRIGQYQAAQQKMKEEVQDARDKAMDYRAQRKWKEAVASIDKALARDPDNLAAKEQAKAILRERNEDYRKEIETLCKNGQWKEAHEALGRFAQEAPDQKDGLVRELTAEVKRTKTREIRRQVASDMDAKSYFRAYTLLRDEKPDDCDDLLRRVVEEGRKYYQSVSQAKREKEGDNYGAYLATVKALKLLGLDPRSPRPDLTDPNGKTILEGYRDCDRLVDDSLRAGICIAAFDSPSADAAAGKEFADRLATDFSRKLPYGLHLDDRRRVEYARTQMNLNVHDTLQLVRVSWVVQGSISMNFVKDRYERDKMVLVSIKRKVTNPYYNAQMDAFRSQYGKNEAKWPKDRLPSNTIIEELPQTASYKVGTEKIEGQVAVSASIYSDTEGAITETGSFQVPKELSVDSSDFCFSDDIRVLDPNVAQRIEAPKPLKMISQLEFKEKLEKVVRAQVGNWLLESFGHREKKFLKEAEDYRRQLQQRQAVEVAAKGYLYCLKADPADVDKASFARLEQLALIDLTEGPARQPVSATGATSTR